MQETTRRLLFGHAVSGVTTVLCLSAGLYLRQQAVGDYRSMILPPSLLVLELAAVMVVVLVGSVSLPATGSQRHLYYVAGALGLIIAMAWAIGWGIGSPWGVPSALGKSVAIYVAAALPLVVTAWGSRLVDREAWLFRSVILPLAGFAGTLAIVPALLMLACALTGDCL